MNNNKEINLGYRIVKIQTTKFEFNEIEEERVNLIFNEGNQLTIDGAVRVDIEKDIETIIFNIETTVTEKNTEKVLIKHIGKTSFKIAGLNSIYNEDSDSFDLPDQFMIQLHSLSYSHARALLATELATTIYRDKFFLPIIDPSIIVTR